MRIDSALLIVVWLGVGCSVFAPRSDRPQAIPGRDLPQAVGYSIVDSRVVPGIKRSLTVRLTGKILIEDLRSLALELRDSDPRRYERTFIVYYLPGMTINAGAWATTHFNPSLKVNILGLSSEEENDLAATANSRSREVVGAWLVDGPAPHRITIFREKGNLFMENLFKDGSELTSELVENATSAGRRFEKKEGTQWGEHYVIDPRGDLQIVDDDGLIATALKTR